MLKLVMKEKKSSPKKIVIVEDDRNLKPMYVEKFSNVGFDVYSADEARAGIELTKKVKPDLVLLDILLPKEDGVYFLEIANKDPELKKIPIVVFSNLENAFIRQKALELGVIDYLIKTDFTPQQIVEKVNHYLKPKLKLKKNKSGLT